MTDFAAEGLLDGLDGREREARQDLLEQLEESGVELDELRRAVAEDRLTLLPVERVLGGGQGGLTAAEVAERAGIPVEVLDVQQRALGLPLAPEEERAYGEGDVAAARDMKLFLDSGLDQSGLEEVTRVVGDGLTRIADAVGDLVANSLLRPGDTERDLGLRYAELARALSPVMARQLDYVFRLKMREDVRNAVVERADLESGKLPGSDTITVCFADLVGFTKLGEELPPQEIGHVAERLARMASDAAEPPVRLVKTIGDAAMLVSSDTESLLDSALDLVDRAEQEGAEFPRLRAGLSRGEAVARSGDWYGRPVNVASRVTEIARPGSVLATRGVRDAGGDRYRWSAAGRRRLKGISEPLPLYRARRLDEDQ